jgi:hypothetical protein
LPIFVTFYLPPIRPYQQARSPHHNQRHPKRFLRRFSKYLPLRRMTIRERTCSVIICSSVRNVSLTTDPYLYVEQSDEAATRFLEDLVTV